jgi:hypothetical protein
MNNNLRIVQPFNYFKWRIIELLAKDELDINLVLPRLQILLDSILPNGETLLYMMVDANSKNLEYLLELCLQGKYTLRMTPNLKGNTPLHICVRDSNI